MEKLSYYDFAENDRKYLEEDFANGRVANMMCSQTQNCCEKYLKHIIDIYYEPQDAAEEESKSAVMHTHSLRKLFNFLTQDMELQIDTAQKKTVILADGYYSRYPGDESFFASKDDVDICEDALHECYTLVNELITVLEFDYTKEDIEKS